jgi:hypothetical protein
MSPRVSDRCHACDAALFLKLARHEDGSVERTAYCASCDRGLDVTSLTARRAALRVAEKRGVA